MDIEKDVLIAKLEAKVFVYEEIISKSNFSTMVQSVLKSRDDVFTRYQIGNLQRKIYEITGNGKVMDLFKIDEIGMFIPNYCPVLTEYYVVL